MKNLRKYLIGFNIGICAEYLYRVGYLIYPVIIIAASLLLLIIDLIGTKDSNIEIKNETTCQIKTS